MYSRLECGVSCIWRVFVRACATSPNPDSPVRSNTHNLLINNPPYIISLYSLHSKLSATTQIVTLLGRHAVVADESECEG